MKNSNQTISDKELEARKKSAFWQGFQRGIPEEKVNDEGKITKVYKNQDGFIYVVSNGVTYKGRAIEYYEDGMKLKLYASYKSTLTEMGVSRTGTYIMFIPFAQIERIYSLEEELSSKVANNWDCLVANNDEQDPY